MNDPRSRPSSGLRRAVSLSTIVVAVFVVFATGMSTADDARNAKPKSTFVDLQPWCNHRLDDDFGEMEGNHLKEVPRGEQTLGGSRFVIGEKLIILHVDEEEQAPEMVAGIKVDASLDRLVFLHGTEYSLEYDPKQEGDEADREIGSYIVHYADRTEEHFPIVFGRDLVDWWGYPDNPDPKTAKIAWKGKNPAATDFGPGISIRLFSISWANPHPEKKVTTIDFVSKGTQCNPFLVAVTAESDRRNAGSQETK